MGPIWGRQDPGGPHAGPMNFAIWETTSFYTYAHNIHTQVYCYLTNMFLSHDPIKKE